MQTDWAAENLRVIRTLMERGAVYRRALAPLVGAVGLAGVAAALLAPFLPLPSARAFAALLDDGGRALSGGGFSPDSTPGS